MCAEFLQPPQIKKILIHKERYIYPDIWACAERIAEKEGLVLTGCDINFPQDKYVIGDSITFFEDTNGLTEDILNIRPYTVNTVFATGGSYAFGNPVVFFGSRTLDFADYAILSQAFNRHQVYVVPTPSDLGIDSPSRVDTHIDQFIGGALSSSNGEVIVPIDSEYLRLSKCSEGVRPNVRFFEVPFDLLEGDHAYQLLNYPVTPSGIAYICPSLSELLLEQDEDLKLDWSKISILPHSIALNDSNAGLKCSINFA